jgi:hypothetical protein
LVIEPSDEVYEGNVLLIHIVQDVRNVKFLGDDGGPDIELCIKCLVAAVTLSSSVL